MSESEYTVGEVARLSHTSVRTLHHYDDIGLLTPERRSPAGYRLYTDDDLQRLQQILFYRALDFGLDDIAAMLADPDRTADDHLRRQHRLVRERIEGSQALLAALEKEMEARRMGMRLTPEEQFEVFGTDKVGGEWAREAEDRWGDTDAYRESQRRAAEYTKDDWARLKEESDAGLRNFADAMRAGLPPTSEPAMALAEAHRLFLTTWFYDCGYDMHRGLAEMYLADDRFRATFDAVAPGLAEYVHDAIIANADLSAGG
ncbi:MAG TPA: MerR family transcriptional regulator [Jatrophihabitantaceae bacterium]